MPYKSLAQEGLFHSANSPVGSEKVAEFDSATKGMHLPKHVKHMKDGGVVAKHSGPNQKVSKDWGVDLTKWADKDGGSTDMGKKGYEVDLSPAGQYDDAVRAEGNTAAKAQMEAKRQQMVNAQGMKKGGMVPGKGSGDHVAALLEPGEVVVPKHIVEEIFTPKRTWDHDEDGE